MGGPAPYWTSWATNTIGKTTSRTDRTPTKASTTTYSYPGDSASATRPHFVTGTTTTGDDPGTASYTADAAGNTVKRPAPGGGEQELVWDELNQLTEVTKNGATVATMVYDASGARLVRQQGDTTTLYVAGSEISLNKVTSAVSANRYYSHAGQTVAVRTGASNDTVTTLVADWQGTTHHQITNSTGALTTTWQDPYGNPRGTPPTGWTGERGFVGGTKDATGLTRIGARDYDPILQRFITVDPIQDLADPLQWNPYLYANNTPITASDPTGLFMCVDNCRFDQRRNDPAVIAREKKRATGKWPKGTPKIYKKAGYLANPKKAFNKKHAIGIEKTPKGGTPPKSKPTDKSTTKGQGGSCVRDRGGCIGPRLDFDQANRAMSTMIDALSWASDFSAGALFGTQTRYRRLEWPEEWRDWAKTSRALGRLTGVGGVLFTLGDEWERHSDPKMSGEERVIRTVGNKAIIYAAGAIGAARAAMVAPKHPYIAAGAALFGGIGDTVGGEQMARAADKIELPRWRR